jgi:hypothetical protein
VTPPEEQHKVITQEGSEMESVQWIAERNRRAALA